MRLLQPCCPPSCAGALNIPLYEVYGMSESCGATTWSTPSTHSFGSCGFPLPGTQLRLDHDPSRDKPGEGDACCLAAFTHPFTHSLTNLTTHLLTHPHSRSQPTHPPYSPIHSPHIHPYTPVGEICFRGRHIMLGYMNNSKKTRETVDPLGWLHSGDVGRIDHHGMLHITGRTKSEDSPTATARFPRRR